MQGRVLWSDRMSFVGEVGENQVKMDAQPPFGAGQGLTPKDLLALGSAGCTGMDVIALMKKYKEPLEGFEVEVEAIPLEKARPPVYKEIHLNFKFTGPVDSEKAIEAVTLSQTKYCGVNAMLAKALPIYYKIFLNGEEIGAGQANFE